MVLPVTDEPHLTEPSLPEHVHEVVILQWDQLTRLDHLKDGACIDGFKLCHGVSSVLLFSLDRLDGAVGPWSLLFVYHI